MRSRVLSLAVSGFGLLLFGHAALLGVYAQGPEMQQQISDLKESLAKNKEQLAQYTWVEQVTVSLKGEQKKQDSFQVKTGPDGKPQKTPLGQTPAPAAASQSSGRGGRVKEHVVEKKKEEYKDYAESMKSLMAKYVPPDKDLLQQAVQNKSVSIAPVAGSTSQVQLAFHDYVKPKDSMTLVFDKVQKQLLGIQVASYLDDPKDVVNLTAKMSRLSDGVSHLDSAVLDGVSKQVKVAIQNSSYKHL